MSSSNANNNTDTVEHSKPIPIAHGHPRRPSFSSDSPPSDSSSDSSISPTSPYPSTPHNNTVHNPRVAASVSPSTSPILSYFLPTSPKSPTTHAFPFRRNFPPVVAEDDAEPEVPTGHRRRASMATWPERGVPPTMPIQPPTAPTAFPEEHQGRAAGLLRRLSLGGALAKPSIPKPPSSPTSPVATVHLARTATVTGTPQMVSPKTPRRVKSLAPGSARPPRAPSPMAERILKGHFDGFN
ncbi:hypothetical protein EUX98_g1941 [Antrodiella citrinella]|uniref:Uncharacterized protein n=1 Tax=Antrodiella citrinella TaxID=2447956 RepID=A0A4S4N333_9APHY|nr:hypothetical protein EUX98_g1941 [Antrodiella citrinella]